MHAYPGQFSTNNFLPRWLKSSTKGFSSFTLTANESSTDCKQTHWLSRPQANHLPEFDQVHRCSPNPKK